MKRIRVTLRSRIRNAVDDKIFEDYHRTHEPFYARHVPALKWPLYYAAATVDVLFGRLQALRCRYFGHPDPVVEDGIAGAEYDTQGRLIDCDGGYVSWYCPRCGEGGHSYF